MKRFIIFAAFLLLAACEVEFQDTSGRAYLAASEFDDPTISTGAAYEPHLKFPARIGVVRLVYGQISITPETERAVFADTMSRIPGTIIQLGPLEARMSGLRYRADLGEIRELAASRHLKYVLIISYDPGRNSAEALFLDVQSGYPYASIEAAAPGRSRTNFWGGPLHNQNRINASTLRLARTLAPDIEALFEGLIARASAAPSG